MKESFARQFWISLAIILASAALAALAIYYLGGDLAAQAIATVNSRSEAQGQVATLQNLANLKSQAPKAAQYQAAMNRLLTDQYGLVAFAGWFSKLGTQYGITANATLQGNGTPGSGSTPGTESVTFDVEGPPDIVTQFLDIVSTKAAGFLFTINTYDVELDGSNYRVTGQGTVFSR